MIRAFFRRLRTRHAEERPAPPASPAPDTASTDPTTKEFERFMETARRLGRIPTPDRTRTDHAVRPTDL